MRKTLAGITIFVLVTLAMLVLAEGVVRALFAEHTVLFPRYHTDVRYGDYTLRRIRPNSRFRHTSVDGTWEFITNAQGFRSTREFSYEKPAGITRVLALGDSHTQGYEVRQDQTYSAVLERFLQLNLGESEVINTGVSGFSTAEALALLENEGLRYNPDAVVLGFFANDLEDNIKAGLFEVDDKGVLQPARYEHIPGVRIQNFIYAIPGIKWLSENSYFYSLLFNKTWVFFKLRLAKQAEDRVVEFAVPQKSAFSNYEVELAAALLKRLYAVCRDNDARLIVVDIPVATGDGSLMSSFPAALRGAARANSDAFIDSRELLGPYAGAAQLHLPHGDRHISEFSHAMIGVAVGREVERLTTRGAAGTDN